YDDVKDCSVFIVIIPLFLNDNHTPEMTTLESAFRNLSRILKKGDIVVLETTVPPMTTETLVRRWLDDGSQLKLGEYYLAYSPERIMTGYSISRLREFPKVIGGVDVESGRRAFEVYRTFIPNLNLVSSARVAEFIKVIEGCYRDVNIALANELFVMADELEVNFSEARDFANHEFCEIHSPSTGVGGHCIPVYPWFLINEMTKRGEYGYARLLRTSREINDGMISYWSEKILLESLKLDKPLAQVKICVKGITYRKGVRELHHSRNLALAKLMLDKGLDVYVYDEDLTRKQVENLGLKWIGLKDADIIFDTYSLKTTAK
ncbi:MAG: nucleotide sugar dehydrogenase, partial [Nitrososphaerales archaeon]